MLGWRELAAKVDSVYAGLPDKDSTLVLCDNYGEAGAINFYTKQNIKAVSFNADYIDWFDLSKRYKNLIRVKEADDGAEKELQTSAPFFQTGVAADSVKNRYAREYGTVIFVFTGAKIEIRDRIKNEIDEKKSDR